MSKASDIAQLVDTTWSRYAYMRDNGHHKFIEKARTCENYFAGNQWAEEDLAILRAAKRPALTINQILRTISNVLGTQIYNRTETLFKPRTGLASEDTANTLTKLFMQIGDNNQMTWVRSDVFADGLITSRGFYDIRMGFTDNMLGEVQIQQLNPKNVLLDPDSDSYDPRDWQDVVTTKWLSIDEIGLIFGPKKAKILRGRSDVGFPHSYDSADFFRDRFGGQDTFPSIFTKDTDNDMVRNVRIVERQWKKLDRREHFLDLQLGDIKPIPTEWEGDQEQIGEHLARNPNIEIVERLVQRVRWTIIADDLLLYDDWSPYDEFTVVPYFPHFRRGTTVGLVENLLSSQELLNKTKSQELHVINTSANSGWILQDGVLTNMPISELEKRGAETGLVIEVSDINQIDKIKPNSIPSGLDRISANAEDYIKTISGVSDAQSGFSREDVAAKAIKANQRGGQANLAKVLDNLERTDFIAARLILNLVQRFYTDERVFRITTDRVTGDSQEITVNQAQPDGSISNDLSLGEYDVIVTSQPERDNFEETQFDQAVTLRTEVGVDISDEHIIQSSKLTEKRAIIEAIRSKAESPEAQKLKAIDMGLKEAELMKAKTEAMKDMTDAQHNQAKVQAALAQARSKNAETVAPEDQGEFALGMAELAFSKQKFSEEMNFKREEADRNFELREDELRATIRIKAAEAKGKLDLAERTAKDKAAQAKASLAAKPKPQPKTAGAKS